MMYNEIASACLQCRLYSHMDNAHCCTAMREHLRPEGLTCGKSYPGLLALSSSVSRGQAHLKMSLTDSMLPSGPRLIAVILGRTPASIPEQMPDALHAMNWACCSISALKLR